MPLQFDNSAGEKNDSKATDSTSAWSRVALLKYISDLLSQILGKQPTLSGGNLPVNVTNLPSTQPVSASSLPLPTGASTADKQDIGNTSLGSIDSKLPTLSGGNVPVIVANTTSVLPTGAATETTLDALNTKVPSAISGRVPVDGSGVTQPVSLSIVPLPIGAASETTLSAAKTNLDAINTADTAINANIGDKADTVASSDTGTFSLISLVKRILQQIATGPTNWTTLQAKIPSLGSANAAAAMPVTGSVETVTGTISAVNSNPTGPATTNSAVEITVNNASLLTIQMGSTGGPPYFVEATVDGLKWYTIQNVFTPTTDGGIYQSTLYGDALYKIDCSGYSKVRVSASISYAGSPVSVVLKAIQGPSFPVLKPVGGSALATNASTESTLQLLNTNTSSILAKTPAFGKTNAANSSPVVDAVESATGTISTQNLNASSGTATTNSAVELTLNGASSLAVQVTGSAYTGALSFQYTVDGTNWVSNGLNVVLNVNTAIANTTIPSGTFGIFQIPCPAATKIRITALAAVTGSCTVTVQALHAGSLAQLTGNLPAGPNGLGSVSITSLPTLASVTTLGTVTTVNSVTSSNLGIPFTITDITSAASGSITSAALTPTFGSSYQVTIPVTAITGSGIIDVVVQESFDSGTNWFNVYQFERITIAGNYISPHLRLRGNRIRYVQTLVSGTSVTRSILRLQSNLNPTCFVQLYDRALAVNSLNAKSATVINTQGSTNVQLVCNLAVVGTLLVLNLEGSDDNTNWYTIPGTLTPGTATTSQLTVNNVNAQFVRANVRTAGSGVTLGYIILKAF